MTEEQITELFEGDKQLVSIWREFLLDNRWVIPDVTNGRWIITDKGKDAITQYWNGV